MKIFDIIMLGIGLSMDAFAISVCKGLVTKDLTIKKSLICGIYFGIAQFIMPIIGYSLARGFDKFLLEIDHWIAFILLSGIGLKMIIEAKKQEEVDSSFGFGTMFPLAVATSIDALAVGVTLAFINTNVLTSAIIIGIITLTLAIIGTRIGLRFGGRIKTKASFVGGGFLILMGIKILIEHLFFQ